MPASKKNVLPKIIVPDAPNVVPNPEDAPVAVVIEPKEKAPRKPKALKPIVEEVPAAPAPAPVVDELKPEPPAVDDIKPKATRKPRAPKTPSVPSEPTIAEPEVPVMPEVAKPKARGRPKKVVDPNAAIPTHQMTEPAKANPKIKVVVDEDGNPTKRKKREPKLDADGNVIKRAPTEYNKFLAKIMAELKEEYKDYEVKPNQKELMAEVAAKWREAKANA